MFCDISEALYSWRSSPGLSPEIHLLWWLELALVSSQMQPTEGITFLTWILCSWQFYIIMCVVFIICILQRFCVSYLDLVMCALWLDK